MIVIKNYKKIEDYQVDELYTHKLYINKYSLDLKYFYELTPEWKHFFFDLLQELKLNGYILVYPNLFDYLKKNWYNIIRKYKLNIDINDYIDLVDYISIDEWEKENNHFLVCGNDFYLIETR